MKKNNLKKRRMNKKTIKELLEQYLEELDERIKTDFYIVKEIINGRANQSEIRQMLKFLRKSLRILNRSIFDLKKRDKRRIKYFIC